MDVVIEGPWGVREQAAFWARVLRHPRRSRVGGMLLPPHPMDEAEAVGPG